MQFDNDNDGVMSEPVPYVSLGYIILTCETIDGIPGEIPGIRNMIVHVCIFPGKFTHTQTHTHVRVHPTRARTHTY